MQRRVPLAVFCLARASLRSLKNHQLTKAAPSLSSQTLTSHRLKRVLMIRSRAAPAISPPSPSLTSTWKLTRNRRARRKSHHVVSVTRRTNPRPRLLKASSPPLNPISEPRVWLSITPRARTRNLKSLPRSARTKKMSSKTKCLNCHR